ncbi:hypothetical protein V3C99_012990 [Haemonchus contortus]
MGQRMFLASNILGMDQSL